MPENKRIIFSTSSSNQLTVKFPSENRARVLDGKFKIGKAGNLVYLINEPSKWLKVYNLPRKIEFKGNWKLNPNYDLVFKLKEEEYFEKKRLVLGDVLKFL